MVSLHEKEKVLVLTAHSPGFELDGYLRSQPDSSDFYTRVSSYFNAQREVGKPIEALLAEFRKAAKFLEGELISGAALDSLLALNYYEVLQDVLIANRQHLIVVGETEAAAKIDNEICCFQRGLLGRFGTVSPLPRLGQMLGEDALVPVGLALRNEVDQIGLVLRSLNRGELESESTDARRISRGDRCFELSGAVSRMLLEIENYPSSPIREELSKMLKETGRRALRYNRESTICRMSGDIVVSSMEGTRNFLRDNTERMYFLTLHGLPTAYDLFCCTYTETPKDYRQELHLHQFSEELTLVLDGSASCLWFSELPAGKGVTYREEGSVTALPFQAFRIKPKVPHTIYNPDQSNKNITVKLTMFIDDRLGTLDWQFAREPKESHPVSIDNGRREEHLWGCRYLYEHGFNGINFTYRVDVINPQCAMGIAPGEEIYFKVVSGEGILKSLENETPVKSGTLAGIRNQVAAELINTTGEALIVFSVQGLSERQLTDDAHVSNLYPIWFLKDFLWLQ